MSDAAKLSKCKVEYNNRSYTYPGVPVSDRQFSISGLSSMICIIVRAKNRLILTGLKYHV